MREWQSYKNLGDVVTIIMGQSPSSDTYNDKEGLPFFQGNADFGKEHPTVRVFCNSPIRIAEPNDILISVRAPIGAINIADRQCCIGRGLAAIRGANSVSNRFLYFFLTASKNTLISQGTGSTFKSIGKDALKNLQMPVFNLNEQERIVSELDLLAGIIDKQKQQLKELDTLAQSIFYDMFGNPEENTKCWRTEKFQTICTSLFAGGDVPKDNYSETKSETYNVPILSNGVGDKAVYGYTNKARVFDECITISGRGTIGYCEVRSEPFFPVVRLIVAVPNKDILLPIVLKYIVDSLHLHGVGVAIPQLTIPMVKNVSIILPSMEMQCLFAKIIQSVESQKKSINRSLAESQKLFDYTMDKYFG